MVASVNENCIGCGLCTQLCPAVFRMGDEGLAEGGSVSPDQFDAAREARDSCPVSAIDVERE